jgi:hypothetical protein
MTIVVGGYIIAYPLGGMTWHHLNYLLGLQELGHDVWFLEDSGSYAMPFNPRLQRCQPDSSYGRDYLKRTLDAFGLPLKYCYYSEFEGRHYGCTETELNDVLRRADLMIFVSGVTPLRASRPRARRSLVIDTDPVFTQLRMARDPDFLAYYRQFDACATFGRLIGSDECNLPVHGIDWIPTHQPIALERWPFHPCESDAFTTVGKWEHASDRDVEFAGRRYLSSKAPEWEKVINLPARTSWQMTLAMQGMPEADRGRFEARGWEFRDPELGTIDCQAFAEMVRKSAGEFSVAKQVYAQLPSGWFSDRSAAYLASGRPVVAQATGFERWLPTGSGLFAFRSKSDAVDALDCVASNPLEHQRAARAIAQAHFDSRKVLNDLIEKVM